MSTTQDFDRTASAWLADGPSELSDRVLDAALREVHLTHQRRRWSTPWRTQVMQMPTRLAAGIAIVAILGIGGLLLLNRGPSIGSPPSPAPTSSSTATASPVIASPILEAPPVYAWPGFLGAGTYATTFIWQSPVTVTFTVPDGWESRDVEVVKEPVGGGRGRSLMFALVDNTYADPCRGTLTDPPVGPTVADLASALAAIPGLEASPGDEAREPAPVAFAGHNGEYLEFSIPTNAACGLGQFHLWNTRADWMTPGLANGGTIFRAERDHYRVWVLDVAGNRYLVAAMWDEDATRNDLIELDAILDSIRFEVAPAP